MTRCFPLTPKSCPRYMTNSQSSCTQSHCTEMRHGSQDHYLLYTGKHPEGWYYWIYMYSEWLPPHRNFNHKSSKSPCQSKLSSYQRSALPKLRQTNTSSSFSINCIYLSIMNILADFQLWYIKILKLLPKENCLSCHPIPAHDTAKMD